MTEEELAASVLDGMVKKKKEPMWPPSDKQVSYVLALQGDRILPPDWKVRSEKEVRRMERPDVSSTIEMLTKFPRKAGGAEQREWSTPPGRYALEVDDDIWFFQVDKPIEGRWAGYTFVKRLIGSPGDYRMDMLNSAQRFKFMKEIERNPREAAVRYGHEHQVCGVCHSPLTNKKSREAGIGPVCARKRGW